MNSETKRIVQHSPYFKRIEKDYEQKILMPSLEEKKKILSSIWDLHAPLDREVLNEYWEKVDKDVQEKTLKRA